MARAPSFSQFCSAHNNFFFPYQALLLALSLFFRWLSFFFAPPSLPFSTCHHHSLPTTNETDFFEVCTPTTSLSLDAIPSTKHLLCRPLSSSAQSSNISSFVANSNHIKMSSKTKASGKAGRSAIADVVSREYTIHMHKRVRFEIQERTGDDEDQQSRKEEDRSTDGGGIGPSEVTGTNRWTVSPWRKARCREGNLETGWRIASRFVMRKCRRTCANIDGNLAARCQLQEAGSPRREGDQEVRPAGYGTEPSTSNPRLSRRHINDSNRLSER